MNEKFSKQLEYYLNDELSIDQFIHNFKILHQKRQVEKTNHLLNEIDPRFKELFDKLKLNIEELTNLQYAGCLNSLEGTNADFKNYVIEFKNSQKTVNISLGGFASSGSGKTEKYIKYPDRVNELKFSFQTPSCHYTGGELDINDENVFQDSMLKIMRFCYDLSSVDVKNFLDNFGKISNKKLLTKIIPNELEY